MTRHLLPLICGLTLVGGLPGGAQASGRLSGDVRPLSQSIELRLDSAAEGYQGAVSIEIEVLKEVPHIALHAADMTLTEASLKRRIFPRDLEVLKPTAAEDAGQIFLSRGKPIKAGRYTLSLSFENDYNQSPYGLYQVKVGEDAYLFTQLEADDARQAFPCFDEPIFKIPYTFTLVVPQGHLAVTNAPEASRSEEAGWTRIAFTPLEPTPSYALAVATGPLERVPLEGMGVPAHIYTVRGRGGEIGVAQEMIPPLLPFLEGYFGSPYPYRKLDLIAVPNFWPGAMENPGAITFKESLLLQDPAHTTPWDKGHLAYVAAHELAHMWFGDLVTLAWWDDFWLNESFATWMGRKTMIATYPELGADVRQITEGLDIMDRDSSTISRPIRLPVDPTAVFESTNFMAYPKGQAVLTMFELWLGEETFREGVRAYIEANRWGNATSEDLWAALKSASGEDVSPAMTPYLDQPGVPLVDIHREGHRLTLSQSRFIIGGGETAPSTPWHIPVSLRFADDRGPQRATLLLTEESATFDLSAEGEIRWIFPAEAGRGYYRWALPPEETRALVAASAQNLTPLERIALLSNLVALTHSGAMDGGVLLELLPAFIQDPSPAVAQRAVEVPGEVVPKELLPEALIPAFAAYLRGACAPALSAIGLTPTGEESPRTQALRADLIALLGRRGEDGAVKAEAARLAEAFLADPGAVERGLAEAALAVYAEEGDGALRARLVEKVDGTRDGGLRAIYLGGLSALPGKAEQEANVAWALGGGDLNVDETTRLLRGLGVREPAMLQDALMTHFDQVIETIDPGYAAWLPTMGVGCSEERLARSEAFYSEEAHHRTGMDRGLKGARLMVEDCVNQKERHLPSIRAFLETYEEEAAPGAQ